MPTQALRGSLLASWDVWRPRRTARVVDTKRCVSVSARTPGMCKPRGGKRQHLSDGFGRIHSEVDSESRAVNIAIGSNILIFGAKVWVSSNSGSSALFAEAVHTLADIGNQLLLRFGIARSTKAPTKEYPCASPCPLCCLLEVRLSRASKARQYTAIREHVMQVWLHEREVHILPHISRWSVLYWCWCLRHQWGICSHRPR